MKLTKFNDVPMAERLESINRFSAQSDLFKVRSFVDSVLTHMAYGPNKPVTLDRVTRLVSQLIDVINAEIDDYESNNSDCDEE